ncbi:MAG: peptidoglycan editing factor PgeF [Rhodoferax sp.]
MRAFCSTRTGGVSTAPFDSLNLGTHVGDTPQAVSTNRANLQAALGVRPLYLDQIHGTDVHRAERLSVDGACADGSWTAETGLACTVMVADCLPILLCTSDGDRVAALHAGWRGLAGNGGADGSALGIVENFLQEQKTWGIDAVRWMAWLGPCIGPQAFEVGDEVRTAFMHGAEIAQQAFTAHGAGKWRADLALLARQRLQAAGVNQIYGNDSTAPWCTVGNPLRFFSHRRDRVSGRFAAGIWRV